MTEQINTAFPSAAKPKRPKPKPKPPKKPKPAVAVKPKPVAPKPKPKPQTFDEQIADLWHATMGANERRQKIADLIESSARAGPTVAMHGMTTPETFRVLTWRGMDIHFTGTVKPGDNIFNSIYDSEFKLQGLSFYPYSLPERLAKATKGVYFTGQNNDLDDYWRKTYTDFTRSHATGGDGNVVSYGNGQVEFGTLTHESGHNLAKTLYGVTDPYGDYRAMLKKTTEPPVSDYAKNSPSEDFAESCRMYCSDRDTMKKDHPERYAIIDRIMTDPSYGG